MLHNREQFNMGKPHLLYIVSECVCQLSVVKKTVPLFSHPLPRTEMNFINSMGMVQGIKGMPVCHPVPITPDIFQIPYPGGGLRWQFTGKSKGIPFINPVIIKPGHNMIFVNSSFLNTGDKTLPYA
jgi:hypothetical protein